MFSFIQKLDKPDRRVLTACFLLFVSSGFLALTMGSALPALSDAYQLSDSFSGLLLSFHSAGNLLAGLVSGLIPVYLGQKRSIILLSSLGFLGYSLITMTGVPALLVAAFFIIGFGRGSITNFTNRQANLLSGGSPAATNLLHACFAVGAIIAPLLFHALSTAVSWRAGIFAVVLICVAVWGNLFRIRIKNDRMNRKDKTNTTLVFLKNPSFLILVGMMFCYLASEYAVNGWLVTYIQSREELLSALTAGGMTLSAFSQMMATLLWTVMLTGRLICAAIAPKVGQKKLMMFASFGMALFYALMLRAPSVALVAVSVAGLGLCMAGICPMIYSDAAIFTNAYPLATSFLLALGSLGGIVMPTLVGALADRSGFSAGMGAIFVTIVLLVVFSVLNVTVPTRKPEQSSES